MKTIIVAVFLLGISGSAWALYERECDECSDYKYGAVYISNIGRTGKVIRCGSVVPNTIYGYAIEVRWDDDGSTNTYNIPEKKIS